MFSHSDVLTPLALTVIIDNKVRDPELTEFRRQATGLIELFELDPMDDEALKIWYHDNAPALKSALSGKRRNTTILKALTRFKDDVHTENLYEAVLAISISDKEYHEEESDLVKSAAAIWGYTRPPFKIVRN